jgi:hypothetical protein
VPMAPLDTLHRRRHGSDAILFAFDLIELDGDRMAPGIDLKPAAATAPPCSGSLQDGLAGNCVESGMRA